MKKLFAAAILMAASSAALAQAYVVGSVGQSDFGDCAGAISCDNKDVGFKLLGGYKFNPYIAVEGGYVNLGKANLVVPVGALRANGEIKSSGVTAAVVASAPIQDFELFAKLGLVYLDTKVDVSVASLGSASVSDNSTDVAFGVGAAYNFNKNVGVRVEFERYRAKFDGEKGDIDLFSAGLQYRF